MSSCCSGELEQETKEIKKLTIIKVLIGCITA